MKTVLVIYIISLIIGILSTIIIVKKRIVNKNVLLFFLTVILLFLRLAPKFQQILWDVNITEGDEGYEYTSTLLTFKNKHLVNSIINRHNYEYTNYPIIHIMATILMIITNIYHVNLSNIAIIIPIALNLYNFLILMVFTDMYPIKDKCLYFLPLIVLLAGYHGYFWNLYLRESYASTFALTLYLAFISKRFFDKTKKSLVFFTLLIPFTHFATTGFLMFSLVFIYAFSLILCRKQNKSLIYFHKTYLIVLLLTFISYNLWNYYRSIYSSRWVAQIINELYFGSLDSLNMFFYNSTTGNEVNTNIYPNIGLKLLPMERIFIFLHYISLFSIQLLLLISTRKNKHVKCSDAFKMLLVLVLSYWCCLFMGRIIFYGQETMHALLRFTPYSLVGFMGLLIKHYHMTKINVFNKFKYVFMPLVIFIILGNVAHYPYTLKYNIPRSDPLDVATYIEQHSVTTYCLIFHKEHYLNSLVEMYLINKAHGIAVYINEGQLRYILNQNLCSNNRYKLFVSNLFLYDTIPNIFNKKYNTIYNNFVYIIDI